MKVENFNTINPLNGQPKAGPPAGIADTNIESSAKQIIEGHTAAGTVLAQSISLSDVKKDAESTTNNVAEKLLRSLQIPVNEQTLSAAKMLMAYNIPITSDVIDKINQYMNLLPGFDIEKATFLVSNNIVQNTTGTNIQNILNHPALLSDILGGNYNLDSELSQLSALINQNGNRTLQSDAIKALTISRIYESLKQTGVLVETQDRSGLKIVISNDLSGQIPNAPRFLYIEPNLIVDKLLSSMTELIQLTQSGQQLQSQGAAQQEIDLLGAAKSFSAEILSVTTALTNTAATTADTTKTIVNSSNAYPADTNAANLMNKEAGNTPETTAAASGVTDNDAKTAVTATTTAAASETVAALEKLFFKIAADYMNGTARHDQLSMSGLQPNVPWTEIDDTQCQIISKMWNVQSQKGMFEASAILERLMLNDRIELSNGSFFAQSEVKVQYENILTKLSLMKSMIVSGEVAEKAMLLQKIDAIENSISLINNMNNQHVFYHIPIQMNDSRSNAELYIMKRGKKNRKINPDDATLFLSLNSINIGRIESLIHIANRKSITLHVRAKNERILNLFKTEYRVIHSALEAKGYKLSRVSYQVLEDKITAANAVKHAHEVFFSHKLSDIDLKI